MTKGGGVAQNRTAVLLQLYRALDEGLARRDEMLSRKLDLARLELLRVRGGAQLFVQGLEIGVTVRLENPRRTRMVAAYAHDVLNRGGFRRRGLDNDVMHCDGGIINYVFFGS